MIDFIYRQQEEVIDQPEKFKSHPYLLNSIRVLESCTACFLWFICKPSPHESSLMAWDVGLSANLLHVIHSRCDES
ncbi:hypothetical protein Hdeb2414_s0010g00342481 [Helianthus debilis subsp. tardiflorus]